MEARGWADCSFSEHQEQPRITAGYIIDDFLIKYSIVWVEVVLLLEKKVYILLWKRTPQYMAKTKGMAIADRAFECTAT